jgi:mycothiol synthase
MTRSNPDRAAVGPASAEELSVGFSLLLSHLPAGERRRRVDQVLQSLDPKSPGLWLARRRETVVGALHAFIQPGRTAMVWGPRTAAGEPQETALALLTTVVHHLTQQSVRMAQALVDLDADAAADALQATGFRHVSDLLYLVSTHREFPSSQPTCDLEFVSFDPAQQDRLERIIERTYEASLDFPEVDRVRPTSDVLAGYRATGVFDARNWLIVRREDRDIGCLLLTDEPQSGQWELIYMGLAVEGRGRGRGITMVRHAQWFTRQAGCQRLALAVDAANAPAISAYAACGFITWDRRRVLVRVF